ncbi:hypothetical protein PACTADRAFT_49096, partial [Pachysolen tannophilus NRRL Y-2460]
MATLSSQKADPKNCTNNNNNNSTSTPIGENEVFAENFNSNRTTDESLKEEESSTMATTKRVKTDLKEVSNSEDGNGLSMNNITAAGTAVSNGNGNGNSNVGDNCGSNFHGSSRKRHRPSSLDLRDHSNLQPNSLRTKDELGKIALKIVSPGLPALSPTMQNTVAISKNIELQQKQLIAARMTTPTTSTATTATTAAATALGAAAPAGATATGAMNANAMGTGGPSAGGPPAGSVNSSINAIKANGGSAVVAANSNIEPQLVTIPPAGLKSIGPTSSMSSSSSNSQHHQHSQQSTSATGLSADLSNLSIPTKRLKRDKIPTPLNVSELVNDVPNQAVKSAPPLRYSYYSRPLVYPYHNQQPQQLPYQQHTSQPYQYARTAVAGGRKIVRPYGQYPPYQQKVTPSHQNFYRYATLPYYTSTYPGAAATAVQPQPLYNSLPPGPALHFAPRFHFLDRSNGAYSFVLSPAQHQQYRTRNANGVNRKNTNNKQGNQSNATVVVRESPSDKLVVDIFPNEVRDAPAIAQPLSAQRENFF